jgi:hypothetical protein
LENIKNKKALKEHHKTCEPYIKKQIRSIRVVKQKHFGTKKKASKKKNRKKLN